MPYRATLPVRSKRGAVQKRIAVALANDAQNWSGKRKAAIHFAGFAGTHDVREANLR